MHFSYALIIQTAQEAWASSLKFKRASKQNEKWSTQLSFTLVYFKGKKGEKHAKARKGSQVLWYSFTSGWEIRTINVIFY